MQRGFTVQLERKLGIPLQKHHCFSHKLNLILRNTAFAKDKVSKKYKFPNLIMEERDLNHLSSFHTSSAKNLAHLREVMEAEGMRPSRPLPIFPVRWSNSHEEVREKENLYSPVWSKHLTRIVASPGFSQSQRDKALEINNFLIDKEARMTSAIMLDVLKLFSKVSREFQLKGRQASVLKMMKHFVIILFLFLGESVIGVSDRIEQLVTGVEDVRLAHSDVLKQFLLDAECPANVAASYLVPLDDTQISHASFLPNTASAFQE